MTKPGYIDCVWLLLISLWLSACSKPVAQSMLEDYADSMSNVLDTEIHLDLASSALQLPAFPTKREIRLETPDIREGMLEVWDFEQCGMMQLISERNSSLGKVMLPSQKMRYELQFIAALQQCRQVMLALDKPSSDQQAFIKRLETIYRIKQQNLGREIWNGIYNSDEIRQHFALGKPPLAPEKEQSGNVLRALEQLHTLSGLTGEEPITLPIWLDEIEGIYYAFYSNEFGASLLPAMLILTETLDKTAAAIEQRLSRKPFCHKDHRPRRAEILRNIFQKYYAGEVQPYMAIMQREGKEWLSLHDQIMHRLPAPEAMRTYQNEVISLTAVDSLWQKWENAHRQHTKAWQDILGQCGMMPGQS